MRPERKDLAAYLFLETIDKRRRDDHDRYAQSHCGDSDTYDKGRKRPRPAESDLAHDKEFGIQLINS